MENEKRLIDATPDDCIKKTKRKTHFAKVIVSGTAEKPYYDIIWFDYMDGQYHIGYGSYNLDFVFQWLSECFEIVDAPTVDAVEVVLCRECQHFGMGSCNANLMACTPQPEDYCSWAERRDGE